MEPSLLSLLHPTQPGFWIVLSAALWLPIKLTERRWSPRHLRWLTMARWVLIPYAGLIAGSLSPRLMGLTGIDWYSTLGIGVILAGAMLAVLSIIRIALQPGPSAEERSSSTASSPAIHPQHRSLPSIAVMILAIGAEQFHWSFLRGAIWELLLLSPKTLDQPGYWAVWIAALLALPEILLQPLAPTQRLVKVVLLAMTAVLFVFTQNFWLCWVFHAAAWMILSTKTVSAQTSPAHR